MAFRKFGTSDDQQVIPDEDKQGVTKEAKQTWTEKDAEELHWENEGGNGGTRQ